MTAARVLLRDLAVIGASLRPAGGQLLLRAGLEPIPGSMVRRICEAKADLLQILTEKHVVEWLNEHPCPSPPGRCAFCGATEVPDAIVLPFGTEPGTHTWLHAECWRPWHEQRRAQAARTLSL